MESSEIREETLHTEATVAPEGSQETKPDQNADSQPNHDNGKPASDTKKGTRKPYDGSKAHGVVVKNISDVEQSTNAKERLVLRLKYLNNEFDKCVSIIQDPAKSISDKIPAVKASEKINEDLKKLQEVADELRAKVPQLEELAKGRVESFDPSVKLEVTI